MYHHRAMEIMRNFFTQVGIFALQWLLSDSREIKLSVLMPWSGNWPIGRRIGEVIPLAIENINNNNNILPGYNLTYIRIDTQSEPGVSLAAMADLWRNEKPFVDVFIGPGFSVICRPTALLAKEWNLPMISWSCSDPKLSDKRQYPTFSRTVTFGRTNPMNTSKAIANVMKHFQWKTFVLMHSKEETWEKLGIELKNELKRRGMEMAMQFSFLPKKTSKEAYKQFLDEAKSKTRVFILLCYVEQAADIVLTAKGIGLAKGDYAFITLDIDFDMSHGTFSQLEHYHDNNTLDGIIDISVNPADNLKFKNLSTKIKERMTKQGHFPVNHMHNEVSQYAAYMYDAITLYALALSDTISQGGNITDGLNVTGNIFGKSFDGMSGHVIIDDRGDRMPLYELRNLQNGTFVKIASITSSGLRFALDANIIWPGGGTTAPKDISQICGQNGVECPTDSGRENVEVYISVPLVILVLVFGSALAVSLYRRTNRIRNVSSMIIKYEDLDLVGYVGRSSSRQTFSFRSQELSARSDDRSSLAGIPTQRYALVGRYQNKPVFVKKVMRRSVSLNEEIVRELYQVNHVSHVNINPYIGVCMTAPNICIISEACSRGSLADVLANDDIKLDWTFKMSFATDIATGMEALHSSDISFHSNLTSSNCLIDRMWVCKVADYGLHHFTKHTYQPEDMIPADSAKLWMAPEHLRNTEYPTKALGSQAGDVYSYAIILSEIVTRNEPYELLRMTTSLHEILRRIMSSEFPPLRPVITVDSCEPAVLKFVQQCWAEEPPSRPTFREIRKSIRKINGGRSLRLVDSMLGKMEIYSNNLEALVEERTHQLEAEKARTDQLLYEMLPRPVADQLKAGKSVEAENFDQVTVFFSDIVGFTRLSSSSTPIQVVNFLNDLYTYFDNIIPNYDVYKVETIGDAYMVVSGLPEKNRDRHAGEIATMALQLICDIRTFKIRHIPDTNPKLRVGIHTGPVVAGVVGIKKPRYDIFGDTVNVASRMESTGVPNRIHISLECRKALMNLGGYHIERRGEIELKGKGKVITYFLNGKDGFNRVRPDPL